MDLKARIEATLFTTGKALTIKEISDIIKNPYEETEEALLELIMDYSSRDSALEIDDEDGYILQVKEEHKDIVESLIPIEMTDGALRTLSAIALKQPILQSDVVGMVGIGAYDHINYLLERELVSKKPKGKSYVIKTTKRFNEYFKLSGDTKALTQILEVQSKN